MRMDMCKDLKQWLNMSRIRTSKFYVLKSQPGLHYLRFE